jgi:hypothetical protein
MGKYDPLYDYLRRKTAPELTMTFRDLERILKAMLPKSANQPGWWTGENPDDSRQPQNLAWQKAGYNAVLIRSDQVVFRRREK